MSESEVARFVDFATGKTSEGLPAGFLVHPGPNGPVVILIVRGGPTIPVELDVENGARLYCQLGTVLRDVVN